MRVLITKEKLRNFLEIVDKITAKKSDLSILNFFQFQTAKDKVIISTTDLEISYQAELSAKVEVEGKVLIPAKPFFAVLNSFNEEMIKLEQNNSTLVIQGENSITSLPGLSNEDYPLIPKFSQDYVFEINNQVFEEALKKISSCLKTADIFKPELAGVYFWLKNDVVKLVTTDTIRLAEISINSKSFSSNFNEKRVLIPKKVIEEYLAIKNKPEELKIYFEPSQITFDLISQYLLSKLAVIEYPNYQQVIPEMFSLSLYINKQELENQLRLNRVFLDQQKELQLTFKARDNKLEFYSKNELIGETRGQIKTEVINSNLPELEDYSISFNFDFFKDGIDAIDAEKIFFGLNFTDNTTTKPAVIKSPLEEDFIYILMPL